MPGIPKSVAFMNKHPYHFSKFQLGTRFYQWVTFMREMHTSLSSGGGVQDLINELRTKLHTGGDAAVLIAEFKEHLNHICLVDPGLQQNTGGGGNTQYEITGTVGYKIAGVFKQKAATQDLSLGAGCDTGAGEYRSAVISLDGSGTVTVTPSAISASAPVALPTPPADECVIGSVQIPASFSNGVTTVQTAWFTNGYPIVATDLAAVTASAVSDPTATVPAELPDTDI